MSETNEIGILIATGQPSIRIGLVMLLNEQNGLHVVAEAGDSHELLKKIESNCPDMLLLDWDLLDRATPILIKTMCGLDQNLTIVTLSAEPDHRGAALEAGADAFVIIGDQPRELLTTIDGLFSSKQI